MFYIKFTLVCLETPSCIFLTPDVSDAWWVYKKAAPGSERLTFHKSLYTKSFFDTLLPTSGKYKNAIVF